MSDYNGGSPTGGELHSFMKKVEKTKRSLAKKAKSRALEGAKHKSHPNVGGKFQDELEAHKRDSDKFR